MALFENHAGFNLTVSKLQLVEVIQKENNLYLENVDEGEFEKEIGENFTESEIVDVLQNTFQILSEKKSIQSKNISLSLSHDYFKIAQIPYEITLLDKDLVEYLNFEFSVLFPQCNLDDFIIRHYQVNKPDILNNRTIIMVSIRKKMVHAIYNFAKANNLTLKNIDNIHIASNSFILVDNVNVKNQLFCSILADGRFISLILLDEKTPVYFKTKKITPGDDLKDLFLNELSLLENLKIRLNDIAKFYIGGDLADDKFLDVIRKSSDLLLLRYNPLDKIKVAPHLYENELFIEKYHCFTAAAGMALRMI